MATRKSSMHDGDHRVGEGHLCQISAVVESFFINHLQASEILQLVEGSDAGVLVERAICLPFRYQARHRGGLGVAQLAVAVGVPVLHADGFHGGVDEDDIA